METNQGRPPPPSRKVKKQVPQKTVDEFWEAFTTKFPGKVHTILPKNAYAKSKAAREPKGTVYGRCAGNSYKEAKADCTATVDKIAQECRRVNMRYRDPHFDIEFDLKSNKRDCLDGLLIYEDAGRPKSVKRVHVSLVISQDKRHRRLNFMKANLRRSALLHKWRHSW